MYVETKVNKHTKSVFAVVLLEDMRKVSSNLCRTEVRGPIPFIPQMNLSFWDVPLPDLSQRLRMGHRCVIGSIRGDVCIV